MFTIRRDQERALRADRIDDFVQRMLGHVRRCFPEHHDALGADTIRELIRDGIKRAERYELVSEQDICLFVDLMLCLGTGFDEEPALPWAGSLLNDRQSGTPTSRLAAVYERSLTHLGNVAENAVREPEHDS